MWLKKACVIHAALNIYIPLNFYCIFMWACGSGQIREETRRDRLKSFERRAFCAMKKWKSSIGLVPTQVRSEKSRKPCRPHSIFVPLSTTQQNRRNSLLCTQQLPLSLSASYGTSQSHHRKSFSLLQTRPHHQHALQP